MIDLKTKEEIALMAKGGKILADVLRKVISHAVVGVSEIELDKFAEKLIRAQGAEPGFMKVPNYKHTICVSTNNVVVHGVPSGYMLREADVIGIDCGVFFKGFHTDMSETLRVISKNKPRFNRGQKDAIDVFLKTGKHALLEAIKMAKVGNRIGHISQTIQKIVEENGYSVVRSLIGHGVGRQLHEEPEVPGYLAVNIDKTLLLKEGMTLAIEVIYNMGKPDVVYGNKDGWTISTKDGSLSGVFERTVAITKKGPEILTS